MSAKQVLLVTDIPDQARSYTDTLTSAGFAVELHDTGAAAIPILRQRALLCAVIDERLPDMSGWELCRHAKTAVDGNGVPVIVLTHDISTQHAEQSLRVGCHAWLARPTVADDLVRSVRHVLDQETAAPSSLEDAMLGMIGCPACASAKIRATLRLSPMQYYKCLQCGFYWRVEVT